MFRHPVDISQAVRLINGNPGLCLPHLKLRTLLDLPVPIGPSLPTKPRIRALVLDKDNTLCPPDTTFIHPAYRKAIELLKNSEEFSHHKDSILVVSNTAGKTASTKHEHAACELEDKLGLPVFRQYRASEETDKPGIGLSVAKYLHQKGAISKPDEIVVIGDKIHTDVVMARMMRSWSVFLENGWRDPDDPEKSYHDIGTRLERYIFFNLFKDFAWDEDDRAFLPWEEPTDKTWQEIHKETRRRYNNRWSHKK